MGDAPPETVVPRETDPASPHGGPVEPRASVALVESAGSAAGAAAARLLEQPSTASYDADDEARRAAVAESIPMVDDSTPLAQELAENARRRIALEGRRFPAPPETRVLTIANQKGGVGKTTTTVNVAAALAQAGLTVLVLDNDPQGNASTALGIDHHAEVPSLYDVLVEGRPLREVVQECPDVPNLLCAPATIDLAGAEIELVSMVARETRLRTALEAYLSERVAAGQPRIDYVLVDCPPSLGLLTVNAFVVAREVFIPIQCEYYALEGLSQLLRNIELIRAHLNPTLHVSTILLTMYDGRTRLAAQVAEEVRTHFPEVVLRTTVPRSVRISEAPSHGQTVMTYDPGSSGALSYLSAARELAERGAGVTSSTAAGDAGDVAQPASTGTPGGGTGAPDAGAATGRPDAGPTGRTSASVTPADAAANQLAGPPAPSVAADQQPPPAPVPTQDGPEPRAEGATEREPWRGTVRDGDSSVAEPAAESASGDLPVAADESSTTGTTSSAPTSFQTEPQEGPAASSVAATDVLAGRTPADEPEVRQHWAPREEDGSVGGFDATVPAAAPATDRERDSDLPSEAVDPGIPVAASDPAGEGSPERGHSGPSTAGVTARSEWSAAAPEASSPAPAGRPGPVQEPSVADGPVDAGSGNESRDTAHRWTRRWGR